MRATPTAPSLEDSVPSPLLDRRTLIQRLRSLNLRPTKSLGQHFLVDPEAVEASVGAAELTPDDHVVEVGPGPGVLTQSLVQVAGQVTAVEVDPRMIALLEPLRRAYPSLRLVEKNVLALDPRELAGGAAYKVVANLPYYITSAVLRHFLETAWRPQLLVLMVQKEVAGRICADPGDMSTLSVSVQAFATPEIVRVVPRDSFYPAPEVDSAIVRLRVYAEPVIAPSRERRFFRLVRAGFHDRRKQLHNAFARNLGANREVVGAILDEAGIDATRRAETLSLDEWSRLTDALERQERP